MTLGELIDVLGGKLVQGSADRQITGVSSVESATENELVFAEDAAPAAAALGSHAGAVVVRAGGAATSPEMLEKGVVEAAQPRLWFARAAKLVKPVLPGIGVHPSAIIGPGVELAEGVTIGAGAVIEEGAVIGAATRIEAGAVIGCSVRVGEHCRIYPRAVLYAGTTLGNRVVVHAGGGAGRRRLWLCARLEQRRVYAVSAAGNISYRRRCGDWGPTRPSTAEHWKKRGSGAERRSTISSTSGITAISART